MMFFTQWITVGLWVSLDNPKIINMLLLLEGFIIYFSLRLWVHLQQSIGDTKHQGFCKSPTSKELLHRTLF